LIPPFFTHFIPDTTDITIQGHRYETAEVKVLGKIEVFLKGDRGAAGKGRLLALPVAVEREVLQCVIGAGGERI
ncbi:MAG: hypothetical protein PWQ91_1702, partial [Eubacteriales bacterium]|nr:hypothetical protein [Eubacteriales bacterium]